MAGLSRAESASIVGELRGQYGSNAGIVRNLLRFTDPGSREYKAAIRNVERYAKGERAIGGTYREALIKSQAPSPVKTRLEEARSSRQTVKTTPGRRVPKAAEPRQTIEERVRRAEQGKHTKRTAKMPLVTVGEESKDNRQLINLRNALQEARVNRATLSFFGWVVVSGDKRKRKLRPMTVDVDDEEFWMDPASAFEDYTTNNLAEFDGELTITWQ
jgi:hypothetical protein